MSSSGEIGRFLVPLSAFQSLMQQVGQPWIVIGGIASSLLSQPRLTADVDIVALMSVEDIPQFLSTAEKAGFFPRLTDAADFARRHRVLLLQHAGSGININISLGVLPFELEAVERRTVLHIGLVDLPLPTPEDLLILKAVAHRPKDMIDIQGLIESHPKMGVERIEHWLHQFAEVLEMPEIWEDVTRLFSASDFQ